MVVGTSVTMAQAAPSSTGGHRTAVTAAAVSTPVHPALNATSCNGVIMMNVQVDKYVPEQNAWVVDAGEEVTVQTRLAESTDPDWWFVDELQAAGYPPAVATTDANGAVSLRTTVHHNTMAYRVLTSTGVVSVATLPVRCTA
jgi:hypothetical protein